MAKALVVDDSRAVRMIIAKSLRGLGFETCEAGNGKEGLAVFAKERSTISLVLTDWNMPEMNGLEFVRALRSDPGLSSLTIIMVTTETETDQILSALEAGANEYVMKPFTSEMLLDKLRMAGVSFCGSAA